MGRSGRGRAVALRVRLLAAGRRSSRRSPAPARVSSTSTSGDGHFIPEITIGPVVRRRSRRWCAGAARGSTAISWSRSPRSTSRRSRRRAETASPSTSRRATSPPARSPQARSLGLGVGVALNPETARRGRGRRGRGRRSRALHVDPSRLLRAGVHARLRSGGSSDCAELLPDGVRIQVDGGINSETIARRATPARTCSSRGARSSGDDDPAAAYAELAELVGSRSRG